MSYAIDTRKFDCKFQIDYNEIYIKLLKIGTVVFWYV